MAKLAADLEGSTMMREPEPMPIIYRQDGGDFGGFGDFGGDFGDYGPGGASDAGTGGGDANEGGADDGTYTEEQLTTLATLPGLTDPAYSDEGLDPDPPYSDEGLGGPDELLDRTLSPSIEFQKQNFLDRFEEGDLTKAEQLLYTQLLNTGLIGVEAKGIMADLLSTPGVAAAAESGYSDGYQYGGILGDALAAREDALGAMSAEIQAALKKREEEKAKAQEDDDYTEAELQEAETSLFGDILGDALGGIKDYFMGPSENKELAFAQAAQDAGYTFSPISDELKMADFVTSQIPYFGLAKAAYSIPAFLTGSRIIGDVDTPYGTFQLTESGDLTAPDMSEDMSDFGNQPIITKKRKAATQPVEEEEKEEKEDKPYFPKISTATLTPAELRTLTNIYGPDTYLLNRDQTGLRALV